MCASNRVENHDECQRDAKSAYADATACNDGDRKACGDRDKDLIAFGRWDSDQWAIWLKQSLEFCSTNERCKEAANRSFANNLRCTQGDRLGCDARTRDVADWEQHRPK
jgi:hypothetical protein